MFKKYDVVRIKNLLAPEDEWNGYMALCISNEYVHRKADKIVIQIKIRDTLWAIEVANVEIVNTAERLHFFRTLDGNQLTQWQDCAFKPKTGDFTI